LPWWSFYTELLLYHSQVIFVVVLILFDLLLNETDAYHPARTGVGVLFCCAQEYEDACQALSDGIIHRSVDQPSL
jgi:hypothetical protein